MQRTCPVWQQHQQHQQQLQQLQGIARKSAAVVRAAAGVQLLSSNSILLQQLLKMARAAATGSSRQQQKQLTAAVLYWADASGGVLSLLCHDLLTEGASQSPVDWGFSQFTDMSCGVLAGAVQIFEAAVRYCVTISSTAATSCGGGRGSGSSRPVVPPAIAQVETTIMGLYPVLVYNGYSSSSSSGSSSSSSGSGGSCKAGLQGLSCSHHQLLHAMLSMLLTSAKVWQMGLRQSMCLELMLNVALAPAHCRTLVETPQHGACLNDTLAAGLATSTPSAAAAAAAVPGVVGGAQVAHIVARYLNCLEQQLRKWVADGDAAGAFDWLALGPPPQLAAERAPREFRPGVDCGDRLEVIMRVAHAGYDIVGSGARADSDRLGLEAAWHRMEGLYPQTKYLMDSVVQDMLAGKRGGRVWMPNDSQRHKLLALLVQLHALADALQGFGSALAASLPSRFGCNWPGCVRLLGVSEGYGLVRGQACVCGGCRQAR